MSKIEQIEEMANIMKMSMDGLGRGKHKFTGFEISAMFAKALYNAGYRKASEVAREIFAEIEKIAMHGTTPFGLCLMSMGEAAFAKLKKKYTEEGK